MDAVLKRDVKSERIKMDPLTEASFDGLGEQQKGDYSKMSKDLEETSKKRKLEHYEKMLNCKPKKLRASLIIHWTYLPKANSSPAARPPA